MSAAPDRLLTDLQRKNDDLRRQLAERTAERDEALAREVALSEVLGVINSSPGDLATVFDAILEKAHSLCGADFGSLQLNDHGKFRSVAARGLAHSLTELLRQPLEPPAGSPPSRLLGGERIVHIADMAELGGQWTDYRRAQAAAEHGFRTALFVPLRRDADLLGFIVAVRREVRLYSEKEIALLENFAGQAVVAIENARLLTETREALEQQTATAEVLQVINSSTGNLAPVFAAILDKAHSLCGVDRGALVTYDGERFLAVATHGMPERYAGVLSRPHRADPGTPNNRLLRGERFVHIPDLMTVLAASEQAGLEADSRTVLLVALRNETGLLGYISAHRTEVRPFAEKEIALLQNFAAQAVVAMENARLLTETREALEQQTATAEVLQVINASPGDLAPVFDAMLERAMRLCEADFGIMFTVAGESARVVAARDVPAELGQFLAQHPPEIGSDTFFGRAVLGRSVLHTADMRSEAAYEISQPLTLTAVDRAGVRALLMAPLLKDDGVSGVFAIFRREARPFSDKQIALLENFAAQAVIAMENARLLTETREALEQQTATAEVLQVINSSPGDLAPVFNAMLDKATRLCEASFGILWNFDGELAAAGALHNVPAAYAELCQAPFRPSPGSGPARMMRGEGTLAIANLTEYPPYRAGDQLARAIVDLAGARSVVIAPLRKDGAVLGAITLYRKEVRPFSDKQIALLENFAAQAVIAMENARLLGELRARTGDLEQSLEYQTATSDVLQVISRSTFDLQAVLDTLIATAARLCGADRGLISTRDEESFRPVATFAQSPDMDTYIRGLSFKPGRGTVTGEALLERRAVHVADITADPAYASAPAVVVISPDRLHSVLAVPLLREGEPIGVINLARRRIEPFTERQIALVQTFADQAVIAVENARLLGELRQRTDEVVELNRGLEARVAAQVDELGRVGRLKRFLAPQLAEMIIAKGEEGVLESHRREIVVVFCDLRGYTAFTETAEPEDVLAFLREYHGALGPLVSQFEGTLDQFSGDGIMVFFNDPVPCPDPAERAVRMAMAMRAAATELIAAWRRRHSFELGFGVGIAQGYATLGQIGFSERSGYTAIGTVCNLAARLCAEAKDGQILVSSRVAGAVEAIAKLEDLGDLAVKGLSRPVSAFNVTEPVSGGVGTRLTSASPR